MNSYSDIIYVDPNNNSTAYADFHIDRLVFLFSKDPSLVFTLLDIFEDRKMSRSFVASSPSTTFGRVPERNHSIWAYLKAASSTTLRTAPSTVPKEESSIIPETASITLPKRTWSTLPKVTDIQYPDSPMSVDSRDSPSPSLSDSMSPPPKEGRKSSDNSNTCTSPIAVSPEVPSPSTEKHDDQKPPDGKEFIKRPLNPYMCWVVTKRKEVLKKNPKMKMSDVNAMLGDMWKRLTDEERRPFFEQSYKSREEHKVLLQENPQLMFKPVNVKRKAKPEVEVSTSPKKLTRSVATRGDSKQDSCPSTPTPSTPTSAHPMQPSTPLINGFRAPAPPSAHPHPFTPSAHSSGQSSGVTSSVAQALGMRVQNTPHPQQAMQQGYPMQHHPQQQHQHQQLGGYPNPNQMGPSGSGIGQVQPGQVLLSLPGPPPYQRPANIHQGLEQYYSSLCQPAFPERGEVPMTQYNPNFYWEQCQQMQAAQGMQQYPY